MNRKTTILLSILAIIFSMFSCSMMLKRSSETSELYRRYADRSDIHAAFIKDYRVDDSTTVDVTTLSAPDQETWEKLLREMNVNEVIIQRQREILKNGTSGVHYYICKKDHPEVRVSIYDNVEYNFVADSPHDRILYVFDVKSEEQLNIIRKKEAHELKNKKHNNNESIS